MENNRENRERLFALYMGQKVLKSKKWSSIDGQPVKITFIYMPGIVNDFSSYIELKPLSQIQDEDIKEVAKINKCTTDRSFIIETLTSITYETFGEILLWLKTFDYLRARGYALPFMGLSVEKQVEYGWVVLA